MCIYASTPLPPSLPVRKCCIKTCAWVISSKAWGQNGTRMPCLAPWVPKVWDLGFTQLLEQTQFLAASLGLM